MTIIGLAILTSVTSNAQLSPNTVSAFSAAGSFTFGTTNFAVGSINSVGGLTPAITYLSATNDSATGAVQVWKSTTGNLCQSNSTTTITVNFSTDANTNVVNSQTNGIVAGNPVVIRHSASDIYEVRIVASVTATNFVVNSAPTYAVVSGDKVYGYTTNFTVPCKATTISLLGQYIGFGSRGEPLLVSTAYTSNGGINGVAGTFLP